MKSVTATVRAMTPEERALKSLELRRRIPADQALLAAIRREDRRERKQRKATQGKGNGAR